MHKLFYKEGQKGEIMLLRCGFSASQEGSTGRKLHGLELERIKTGILKQQGQW